MGIVVERAFVRVCIVQHPLNRVYIGHERGSSRDVVKLRTSNFLISRLIMGDKRKVVIVKNDIDSGPVQMSSIRHTSTGISKHADVGVFVLFLLNICFRPSVP